MEELQPAVVLALMTAPDAAVGEVIARELVALRLAACVNIVPGVQSVYRWEGGVCVDAEVQLLMKTTADRVAALRERALAIHPYTTPELIVMNVVEGNPAYIQWVRDSVAPAIDPARGAE